MVYLNSQFPKLQSIMVGSANQSRTSHIKTRWKRKGKDIMGMIYSKIKAETKFKTDLTPVATSQSPASSVPQQLLMSPKSPHLAVSDEDQGCHMMQ